MTHLRSLIALLLLPCTTLSLWATQPEVIVGISLLAPNAESQGYISGPARDKGSLEQVTVADMPFSSALRVTIHERQATTHHTQLAVPVQGAMERGEPLYLEFWARLVFTEAETGMIEASNVIELNAVPHSKVLNPYPWSGAYEWTRIRIPFTATATVATGRGVINFRLGGAVQTVDIAGITLARLPAGTDVTTLPRSLPELYDGHEPDAPWRAIAEESIREHRMEDLHIQVLNATGQPIPGANIEVKQLTHAFRFGVAVNNWRLFPTQMTPSLETYRDIVTRYFNQGTLESAHKWGTWEQRREQAIATVDWLTEHDMTTRGHVLLWPSWRRVPQHIRELKDQPEVLRERIAEHIADIISTTQGIVIDWDVVNEPQTHYDILELLGYDYVIEAFQMAQELDPDARLFLNEALNFNSVDKLRIFEEQALDWRERGAPIDGLGIQAHYSGWSLTPPEKIWEELDRLAAHGFVLQVTEFDIDTDDDELQARYLRDFYTALFAHPAVDTIQMWGFWEGSHWKPAAALWRQDWSIKPSGEAYVDLMENVWRTRETLTTDARGQASLRGFLGDYAITISHDGQTLSLLLPLEKGSETLLVQLPE